MTKNMFCFQVVGVVVAVILLPFLLLWDPALYSKEK